MEMGELEFKISRSEKATLLATPRKSGPWTSPEKGGKHSDTQTKSPDGAGRKAPLIHTLEPQGNCFPKQCWQHPHPGSSGGIYS